MKGEPSSRRSQPRPARVVSLQRAAKTRPSRQVTCSSSKAEKGKRARTSGRVWEDGCTNLGPGARDTQRDHLPLLNRKKVHSPAPPTSLLET